jgi:hypothetical protein
MSKSRGLTKGKSAQQKVATQRAKNGGNYFSKATLAKLRKAGKKGKGRAVSPATIAKRKASRYEKNGGEFHSEETKLKLSAAHKGRKKSAATKAKLSQSHSGKTLSAEHKKNISLAGMGRKNTAATKKLMSLSAKERIRNLTPSEKAEWLDKLRSDRSPEPFKSAAGVKIQAHSRWEISLFKLLEKLGVEFKYSNLDTGTTLDLGICSWSPDFILKRRSLIIEVKGNHWPMRRFSKKTFPAFTKSAYADKYTVALLPKDIGPYVKDINSLEELLGHCVFVHVLPRYATRFTEMPLPKYKRIK